MNNHKICLTILLVIMTIWFPAHAKFTVGFWGDCRSNSGNAFEEICGYLLAEKGTTVDVHWQNGDYTQGGSSGNWADSWAITNVRQACIKDYFFMCTSNHDANSTTFQANLGSILPSNGSNCFFYHQAWDIPGTSRKVHLFAVDLYFVNSGTQVTYFANILKDIDPDDWICALYHNPTYGSLTYKPTHSTALNTFVPLFSQYGGDFILNGHAHVYRRTHVLNDDGSVAEYTGGPGTVHESPEGSQGMVHIVNGRGGVFSSSADGSSWSSTAFGPALSSSEGLITLMEFEGDQVYIKTIVIADDYTHKSVLEDWTWIRGRHGPDTTAPYFISLLPSGTQYSTQVTLQALTNENAYVRWSLTNQTYSAMTNQFLTGEGTKNHSTTVTGQHGQSYTYYLRAMDDSSNAMDTSGIISFDIDTSCFKAAWIEPVYDHSGWDTGPAELGYGDGNEATVIASIYTAYFRHAFNVANASSISSLSMDFKYDDGAIVYLNGEEVLRIGMPAGAVTYDTWASVSHEGSGFSTMDLSAHVDKLVDGENIMAVEVHQIGSSSSDISFDVGLTAGTSTLIAQGAQWRYYDKGDAPADMNTCTTRIVLADKGSRHAPVLVVRPNPFRPTAFIQLKADPRQFQSNSGKIKIHYIDGSLAMHKEVPSYRLVKGIKWTPRHLPSGIYVVRFEIDNKRFIAKALYQK